MEIEQAQINNLYRSSRGSSQYFIATLLLHSVSVSLSVYHVQLEPEKGGSPSQASVLH